MADLMGLPDVAALTELATRAKGDVNVCFVPALAGLGAPYWKDRALAALTGMSLATSRSDVARAALEAIALQICDVFGAMERDLGARLGRLSVDGGATQNDLLMQFQADLLGRPVQRLKVLELSAFGAGVLAGAASGLMDEAGIEAMLNSASEEINPRLDPSSRQAENWRLERGSQLGHRWCKELSTSFLSVRARKATTRRQGRGAHSAPR